MSAAAGVQELTTNLAQLSVLERPVEYTRMGVDAALHGRGAAMSLCRQVLADVAGATGRSPVDLGTLHEHPERVLAAALRVGMREARIYSPTDVAAAVDPRSTTARWERLGAAATRAHQAWTETADVPSGEAGRAAIGDIAVVALGIAHLDRKLVQAAARVGADDVARDLRFAEHGGLHFAARAVLDKAAGHATKPWEAPGRPRLDRLPVVPVSRADDLPRGLRRLHELLSADVDLSPQHTAMLITAQMRMSASLAQQAERTARATGAGAWSNLAIELKANAGRLGEAWGRSERTLISMHPSDMRPIHQAGECLRYLINGLVPAASLEDMVGQFISLAEVTARSIERSVAAGRWALPATHSEAEWAVSWRLAGAGDTSRALTTLRSIGWARATRIESGPVGRHVSTPTSEPVMNRHVPLL
ncbi:hypothetical protein [Kineococcus terrestris]|uniref:hypothetical protein n=1 Tax=Kineococcus terrestris TaxID=2044856 RepID=UPI0034DB5E64